MENNTMTFWNLISNHKINIPIIQRDYAQGREEEETKRNRFLTSLHKHLVIPDTNNLDLDFIYGRVTDDIFYPIDGQQRLTTLFLLHWYIALKEDDVPFADFIILKKFIYDTRISSREFCAALIDEKITISNDSSIVDEIVNKHWFRRSWEKDPTIKAMLIMIEAIHVKFSKTNVKLWNKLTTSSIVAFQVLDLGKKGFDLTDELYIKMNARGKQLTSFENFKANFIQFIDKELKDKKLQHPIKGKISYSGYFSYKIEKEWTDLFWTFREDRTVVDKLFLNYFKFIAQMCYYKNNIKKEDFDFNKFEEIFRSEENLLFLFNSLDLLYEISSPNGEASRIVNQEFFDSIFNPNNSDAVVLFWNTSGNTNLLEHCIYDNSKSDNLNNNQILFYSLIHYLLENKQKTVTLELKKYLRVIRNFLQYIRQKNDTKYNTNVRINNFGSYWILFEKIATSNVYETLVNLSGIKGSLISDVNIENEKVKAQIIIDDIAKSNEIYLLENLKQFEGIIHLLKPNENITKLKDFNKLITQIWDSSVSDTLRIKALIACGFKGIYTKNCKMGKMWYFGKENNWQRILTAEDDDISNIIVDFLFKYKENNKLSTDEKLKDIVSDWFINNTTNRTWRYYFLKYNAFTSGLNYYVRNNDYDIRMLGTDGTNPLVAYHISPYVLTVCREINDKSICNEADCYLQYTGNSPLYLKNGVSLTCTNEGWLIDDDENLISDIIIADFSLTLNDGKYLLKDTIDKDRIETATSLIRKIY